MSDVTPEPSAKPEEAVEFPPEAEDPATEPAESLADDGTPGAVPPEDS